jgi:hypothetical protein
MQVYDIANNQITGSAFMGTVGLNWQVAGVSNHGMQSDLVLRDSGSGGLEIYNIANNQITGAAFLGSVGLDWQVSGFGDFSSRNEGDMLLRNVNPITRAEGSNSCSNFSRFGNTSSSMRICPAVILPHKYRYLHPSVPVIPELAVVRIIPLLADHKTLAVHSVRPGRRALVACGRRDAGKQRLNVVQRARHQASSRGEAMAARISDKVAIGRSGAAGGTASAQP